MRKPIQLLDHDGYLHALADDGTIWQLATSGWTKIEGLPQPPNDTGVEWSDRQPWLIDGVNGLWASNGKRVVRMQDEAEARRFAEKDAWLIAARDVDAATEIHGMIGMLGGPGRLGDPWRQELETGGRLLTYIALPKLNELASAANPENAA